MVNSYQYYWILWNFRLWVLKRIVANNLLDARAQWLNDCRCLGENTDVEFDCKFLVNIYVCLNQPVEWMTKRATERQRTLLVTGWKHVWLLWWFGFKSWAVDEWHFMKCNYPQNLAIVNRIEHLYCGGLTECGIFSHSYSSLIQKRSLECWQANIRTSKTQRRVLNER